MDSSAVPSGPDPLQRAADALRRLDLPAAVAAYDELLATSPPAGAEQRGTALLGRGLARQLLGHHGAIGDVTAALDAWRSAPRGWTASALSELAAALEDSDPSAAAAYWDTAQRLAMAAGDPGAAARIAGERGNRAALAGEWDEAARLLSVAEELGRGAGEDSVAAAALIGLARLDHDAGAVLRAARRVGEAIALAPAGPHLDAARWLLCDLAADAVRTGRLDDAEVLLEEALQLSDDGAAGVRTRALAALAGLAFQRNDRERALSAAGAVLHVVRGSGDDTELAYALHDIAATAMANGMTDDAYRWLVESLALAKRRRLPIVMASAARSLAAIALDRADQLRALGYAEQAAALASEPADLAASAMTLRAVGAEAERWRRYDIGLAAQRAAATMFRALDDTGLAAECEDAVARLAAAGEATVDQQSRVETALDLARRITEQD